MEKGRRVRSSAHPKGSASASPMGKGRRSWAVSIPEARPLPYQWASQELGRCLADGKEGGFQGIAHLKGSAVALPMGVREDPEQGLFQRPGRIQKCPAPRAANVNTAFPRRHCQIRERREMCEG